MTFRFNFLQWVFSQLFGSKAKAFFDAQIAPIIEAAITNATNPQDAINQLINGDTFSHLLDMLMKGVGIPSYYQDFVKALLISYIQAYAATVLSKLAVKASLCAHVPMKTTAPFWN